MGMFDHFEYAAVFADMFRCTCGAQASGLQTKDFDCMLISIQMADDGTLEIKGPHGSEEEPLYWRVIRDTRYAYVYQECGTCSHWNEWRLHVRGGKVVEIVRHERDDL